MPLTIIHGDSKGAEDTLCQLSNRHTILSQTVTHGLLDPEQLNLIKQIRLYCSDITNEKLINTVTNSAIFRKLSPLLLQYNLDYFTTKQIDLALRIIKSTSKKKTISIQSQDLADLHSSKAQEFSSIQTVADCIVCVQAGSILESARTLAVLGKAKKIICLEKSYEKVLLSTHITTHLGLENIEIIHCAGENFSYDNVDRIYIPNIVQNKDTVLKRIHETATKKPTVLTQYATGLSSVFYKNYSSSMLTSFSLEDRIDCSRRFSKRELHKLKAY